MEEIDNLVLPPKEKKLLEGKAKLDWPMDLLKKNIIDKDNYFLFDDDRFCGDI